MTDAPTRRQAEHDARLDAEEAADAGPAGEDATDCAIDPDTF